MITAITADLNHRDMMNTEKSLERLSGWLTFSVFIVSLWF
jgi:hypothetical protein